MSSIPSPGKDLLESPLVPKALLTPRRLVCLLLIVFIAGFGGIFFGRPALHLWRERQAGKLTEEAVRLIHAEKYDSAARLLTKAYGQNSGNPQILRTIARLLSDSIGDKERAIYFWRQLVMTNAATLEDRMSLGLALASNSQFSEAQKLLDDVSESDRHRRPVLELEAQMLRHDGHPAEADKLLRGALKQEPDNAGCKLRLALMDMVSPFDEVQQDALKSIWEVARGSSDSALPALDVLAGVRSLTPAQTAELRQLVEGHGEVSERHRLLALAAYLKKAGAAGPKERSATRKTLT